MNIVDKAKHRADLILPKLEAMRNNGSTSRNHDVLVWIASVRGYRELLNKPCKIPDDVLATELLETVGQAEMFLADIVLRGH